MRPIKFRAWDYHKIWLVGSWEELHSPSLKIMQFTGLYDKNGKEIWEGDLIKWLGLILTITVDDFHGYRFMVGKDQLSKSYAIDGEVIGNIYENPDLLPKAA